MLAFSLASATFLSESPYMRRAMNRAQQLKARIEEFDGMARIEQSAEARKFYRDLEVETEEQLAIEIRKVSAAATRD